MNRLPCHPPRSAPQPAAGRGASLRKWMAARLAPSLLITGIVLGGVATGSHAADWLDQRGAGPIIGDVAAGKEKSFVCRACHGQQGHSPIPQFPNLGGQHAEYMYWEMVKYQRSIRPQSPMSEQMAPMSDQDLRDIAVFFASQVVAPVTTTTKAGEAGERGNRLYREGDPEAGVPPCQGCHGVNGAGIAGRPDWPILRMQHGEYLAMRLRAYRDGTAPRASNDFIMEGVAKHLDDTMINDLATWLDSMHFAQP